MMPMLRKSRIVILGPILFLAFLGFLWLFRLSSDFGGRLSLSSTNGGKVLGDVPRSANELNTTVPFWHQVLTALVESKPQCSLPNVTMEAPLRDFAALKKGAKDSPDLIKIPRKDVDELRETHKKYVAHLPELAFQLPYAQGTKGIVTIAAGESMPMLVVSLKMLRRTGSKLPVNVFMRSSEDYEQDLCGRILPSLNATCLVLEQVLGDLLEHVEVGLGLLKILAILFAPFEDIFWIDAGCFALEQLEESLNGEPFMSSGLVSWPDKWAITASPHYYEISSVSAPSISERAALSSSQLLINKSRHASTLLLALYYNYYGPSYYYPLLFQRPIASEGEKETYVAAANALNNTFYAVSTKPKTLGFQLDNADEFQKCGTVHFSSQEDYALYSLKNSSMKRVKPSFFQTHTYQMDAASLAYNFRLEVNKRMYGAKEEMVALFGRDVEKQFWAETVYTGCHLHASFKAWKDMTGICKKIGSAYKFLFD